MWNSLVKTYGNNFEKLYEEARATQNHCARANLGSSGILHDYVLPKFNADGTHEPWREKDVPWNDYEKFNEKAIDSEKKR